jgi:hypothetical protein
MREFLLELRISISGLNKAQELSPYQIFQRVARAGGLKRKGRQKSFFSGG